MVADEILFRSTSAAVMVSFMMVRGYFSRRLGREPVATGRAQVRDRTYTDSWPRSTFCRLPIR
jgi:hypothetical protein